MQYIQPFDILKPSPQICSKNAILRLTVLIHPPGYDFRDRGLKIVGVQHFSVKATFQSYAAILNRLKVTKLLS